jgi:hypothetical protein
MLEHERKGSGNVKGKEKGNGCTQALEIVNERVKSSWTLAKQID